MYVNNRSQFDWNEKGITILKAWVEQNNMQNWILLAYDQSVVSVGYKDEYKL